MMVLAVGALMLLLLLMSRASHAVKLANSPSRPLDPQHKGALRGLGAT